MATQRESLALLVRSHRERKKLTQDAVATACSTNRSAVAHLEQGLRIPKPDLLQLICDYVEVPHRFWQPFTEPTSVQRFGFEESLAELVGQPVNLDGHDYASEVTVQKQIAELFDSNVSDRQTFDLVNSILLFYGVRPLSRALFERYLTPIAFGSIASFQQKIVAYQTEAVRLFSSLREAFDRLNGAGQSLPHLLAPLSPKDLSRYHARADWDGIEQIGPERLPDLGYVSAAIARQESAERATVQAFLENFAADVRASGRSALDSISSKQRRRMDSLLRKFHSSIAHGLFSPLFAPDPDVLEREAEALGPKSDHELERIANTQAVGMRNLASYLSADYLDVYVATSMRSGADYVSVDRFVKTLFANDLIRPLKLRYFNPTQSWIEDRIAKGLVEALMLKRAAVTIYMAQKSDTFGKDSEASVALGQGKPVIVYVPKLTVGEHVVDTETLCRLTRSELVRMTGDADPDFEIDDAIDEEALVGVVLTALIDSASDEALVESIRRHWHDFDLYGEAARIHGTKLKAAYRGVLDSIIQTDQTVDIPEDIRHDLVGILVATAIRFEGRARVFREIHPLALQVILSTGVLNGILVVRSVEQCAVVLNALLRNSLDLNMVTDEKNYRLVERTTGSTVRVISRHKLLGNAFERHYSSSLAVKSGADLMRSPEESQSRPPTTGCD